MSTMAFRTVGFIRVASCSFVTHDSGANDQTPIVLPSNEQTNLVTWLPSSPCAESSTDQRAKPRWGQRTGKTQCF